jgi:hypothetical protein
MEIKSKYVLGKEIIYTDLILKKALLHGIQELEMNGL